ncbi:hypothetical protein ASPWEDRAFT_37445 [Aspergillus wentii DTO 134E9]|uniref:Invertebrate defensins family profile domain-containing protein n=1 Tax=Aspergillus wentii DTO 134E9 TaxID=1073089 RepID=A0A1L9RXF1_ASPWE|nr:uncharacterized protein ASPWEDRAFT_37445 [Aspergillus wentii DTO 134E9]KAI9931695.1 hypothetical protein MW887_010272 [Aspergillus wentii]OJJ39631.1 hypothetical protein ASPWEDRAFT_37445 [Aspergillus wentii DTO 134E9]
MRFSIASLGLFLAVVGSAAAAPSEQVARGNTECGQDFNGAKTCVANCAKGSCHVIALGPLHQCRC